MFNYCSIKDQDYIDLVVLVITAIELDFILSKIIILANLFNFVN